MEIDKHRFTTFLILFGCLLSPPAAVADQASDVHDLAARADALMRLGVTEKGASRAFNNASELLDQAQQQLAEADLSSDSRGELALEIAAVREDLQDLVELYEGRFFSVFPLVRLTLPSLLADEGLVLTEQVFHTPEAAAVMIATREVADLLDEYHHPYVLFRSSPTDRRLENLAAEELLRDGRSTPYTRKTLVTALGPEELAAFDRGELEPQIIDGLATALDAVSLLVLTIGQSVELEDAHVRSIHGEYFQQGVVISGSLDSSRWVKIEAFDVIGSARDRRGQYRRIAITELFLFVLALLWSAPVKWSANRRLRVVNRLVVGPTLFVFGRLYAIVVIYLMRRFIPDASAMAVAAWWWPALLGLLVILGGGLIAWIGQASLTNIVPGTRGARAVGTIFAMVALGASSRFVAPILMLDPDVGPVNFLLVLFATLSLTLLFAFAARTGPPVPHYFAVGPLLVAPVVGIFMAANSTSLLWLTLALSTALCLAAWIRHRVARARGTEEPEPTPEEAADMDQEKLLKIGKAVSKEL